MNNLEGLLVPGAVVNKIITNIKTKHQIVLFAVDLDGNTVLVGPIVGRKDKDWFRGCWTLDKEDILRDYF